MNICNGVICYLSILCYRAGLDSVAPEKGSVHLLHDDLVVEEPDQLLEDEEEQDPGRDVFWMMQSGLVEIFLP